MKSSIAANEKKPKNPVFLFLRVKFLHDQFLILTVHGSLRK
jgi:hypothetical protein